jgi:hypothetical protein
MYAPLLGPCAPCIRAFLNSLFKIAFLNKLIKEKSILKNADTSALPVFTEALRTLTPI